VTPGTLTYGDNVIAAMQQHKALRLIVISAAGVGESWQQRYRPEYSQCTR
jgi:hypothetical protein